MSRPLLLVVAHETESAASLCQFINLFVPSNEITHSVKQVSYACPAELFETLDSLAPEQLLNTMVLFDTGTSESEAWNVMRMTGERGLLAQLVLSYPEIYFVFVSSSNLGESVLPDREALFPKKIFEKQDYDKDGWENLWQILKQHHFVEMTDFFRIISLIKIHAAGFRTLFDATGLRSSLKLQLLTQLKSKLHNVLAGIYDKFSLQRLKSAAIVTEEEASFLYLNGYAAYKFGSRVWLAYSLSEFLRLLDNPAGAGEGEVLPDVKPQQKFETAIMDWHLVYRDDEAATNKKIQAVRDAALRNKSKIFHPIVVTSFPQALENCYSRKSPNFFQKTFDLLRRNNPAPETTEDASTRASESEGQTPAAISQSESDAFSSWYKEAVVLQKPYGGFFDLLLSQPRQYSETSRSSDGKGYNNCRAQYEDIWKSIEEETTGKLQTTRGNPTYLPHSAPYACSVVAERLLARVNQIKLSEPIATELWVYAALLAAEAKEILGSLSLTTSYQAIALQHEAEVRAEVSFLGMSTEIEVKERLRCLSREIEQVQRAAHGFSDKEKNHKRMSEIGKLNCLLSIIHSLRLRFTAHEQIEASEICLNEYVKHHQQFKKKTNWASRSNFLMKLIRAGFSWLSWYLDAVTKAGTSVTRLFICSFLWTVFFFLCFWGLFWFHPAMENNIQKSALTAFGHSAFTFIELQPGINEAEEMRSFAMSERLIKKANEDSEQPPKSPTETGIGGENTGVTQNPQLEWSRKSWLVSYWLLLSFELIIAYVHLGLLISVLYRRITKRAP